MKLDPDYRPELVVSKDETRYQLHDPYLDATAGKLVATDGRRLVAVPVEVAEGESSRYVDCALLRAARRWRRHYVPSAAIEIVIDGVQGGPTWPTDQDRRFPDWKGALPGKKEGDPGTVTLSLDAHFLQTLALALGGKEDAEGSCQVVVTIDITKPWAPLAVRRNGGQGGVGVLMPVTFMTDRDGTRRCVSFVPEALLAKVPDAP